MNEWNNFWPAIAGAAATLTGLIFVGMSFSLQKLLSNAYLVVRAMQSLILLLIVLVIAIVNLIPGQPARLLSIEIVTISTIVWLINIRIDIKSFRNIEKKYKKYVWQNILLNQIAILPYIIAGISLCCNVASGVYWLVPAIIFSLIKGVFNAWILVIEIYR